MSLYERVVVEGYYHERLWRRDYKLSDLKPAVRKLIRKFKLGKFSGSAEVVFPITHTGMREAKALIAALNKLGKDHGSWTSEDSVELRPNAFVLGRA